MAEPVPPEVRVRLDGLIVAVSPEYDLPTDSVTVPEKPPVEDNVIVDVADPVTGTFRGVVTAVIVKSRGAAVTITVTMVEWVV